MFGALRALSVFPEQVPWFCISGINTGVITTPVVPLATCQGRGGWKILVECQDRGCVEEPCNMSGQGI